MLLSLDLVQLGPTLFLTSWVTWHKVSTKSSFSMEIEKFSPDPKFGFSSHYNIDPKLGFSSHDNIENKDICGWKIWLFSMFQECSIFLICFASKAIYWIKQIIVVCFEKPSVVELSNFEMLDQFLLRFFMFLGIAIFKSKKILNTWRYN